MNTRETEFERQLWRETLYQSLAREGNEDSAEHTSHFDRLIDNGMSGETACQLLYNAYGSGVSEFLERQMRQYSQNHAGIPTQNRLRDLIKRFNNSIDVLKDLTIDGKGLDEHERERIKINMPYASAKTYTATASENHSNPKARAAKSLSLEVVMY